MTEDPVKLYVIVMAILLCVLGYVAYDSYKQASAFEAALDRAPREAKQMKELAAEVKSLVEQLEGSKLRAGERTLIEEATKDLGIAYSSFNTDTASIGRGVKGKEKRFKISFGSGRSSPPLTRSKIVSLCQRVEHNSSGILKTIEIDISRVSGDGAPEPGKAEVVTGEIYRGSVVFGLRSVD